MHVNMIYDDIPYDFHAIDGYSPLLSYICFYTNVFISIWMETFHFYSKKSYENDAWFVKGIFLKRKIFLYRRKFVLKILEQEN